MPNRFFKQFGLLLIFSVSLTTGCSVVDWIFPDKSDDYKKAKVIKKLEVPPDLTTTPHTDELIVRGDEIGTSQAVDKQAEAESSLPDTDLNDETARKINAETQDADVAVPAASAEAAKAGGQIIFKRVEDKHWLLVKQPVAAVWPKARQFWVDKEYVLTQDDKAVGVLETDWVNSTAITPGTRRTGIVGRMLSNEVASVYRDRYRMQLEPGAESGTTEIYIRHQGIQEVLEGTDEDIPVSRWEPRPSEPGLESEMLKRLMLALGATVEDVINPEKAASATAAPQRTAAAGIHSVFSKGSFNRPELLIDQGSSAAWNNVGKALAAAGIKISDLNRSKGIYYIEADDIPEPEKKEGFLSGLLGGNVRGVDTDEDEDSRMLVKLNEKGEQTRVIVTDDAGVTDNSSLATQLLKMIQLQLGKL
ncbi:MAG: outer membrane protein assembly factor BamC [Gammaproteobacteria bacterium]